MELELGLLIVGGIVFLLIILCWMYQEIRVLIDRIKYRKEDKIIRELEDMIEEIHNKSNS